MQSEKPVITPIAKCLFDPSHLFWNGVDPMAAIRALVEAIFHVHGKDCYMVPQQRQRVLREEIAPYQTNSDNSNLNDSLLRDVPLP